MYIVHSFLVPQHSDGSVSSWTNIRCLFDLEKSKSLKKAPQLTTSHIDPTPIMRMKVKLAAQVLSHRTASAMRSCAKDLPTSSARTADFIELVNNMFDFLNSSSLQEVGTRRPALKQLWISQQQVSI